MRPHPPAFSEKIQLLWVTTTSGERSHGQETPVVSTRLADADDHLSEIAVAIPPVNLEVLTLKHSAFIAQLLMDELDLGKSTLRGSQDHAVFSIRATDASTGQVLAAERSSNNMPVSWYHVQDLQQCLWAETEGIGPDLWLLPAGAGGLGRATEIKRKDRKTTQKINKRTEKWFFSTSETTRRFWRHCLARFAKVHHTQQKYMNNGTKQGEIACTRAKTVAKCRQAGN